MSDEMMACPKCDSPYGYFLSDASYACPDCKNEWNPSLDNQENTFIVKDVNGNVLSDGDTVVIIKALPVKGSSSSIKGGTKVRKIRLVDDDHNIDCKIDGFGSMALKSKFVKKA